MSGISDFLDDMELINANDVSPATEETEKKEEKEVEKKEKVEKENVDDEESEDESDDAEDDEEDDEDVYQRLDETGFSVYMIIVNGKPKYYVTTVAEAKDCIWHVAKCLVEKLNPDYNIYFTMPNRYTVNVERRSKWAIISYDEIIHSVSFQKIKGVELVEVDVKSGARTGRKKYE